MRLVIACLALLELIEETSFLIDRIVELCKTVSELAAVDEEFEAIRNARILEIALRQRGNLRRMSR